MGCLLENTVKLDMIELYGTTYYEYGVRRTFTVYAARLFMSLVTLKIADALH